MKLSIATAFLTATAAAFSPAGQVSDLYYFIDLMVGENGKKEFSWKTSWLSCEFDHGLIRLYL